MASTISEVYTGPWTNWSRGRIYGPTLTLSQADASFLTALVAIFVSFAGTRCWRICCLALHFRSSSNSSRSRDGLHHQLQTILRNSPDAFTIFNISGQLFWAWRAVARNTGWRTLPLAMLALIWSLAWALAATFSSQISSALGNEVLLDSRNCGSLDFTQGPEYLYTNQTAIATELHPYLAKQMQTAAGYSQQCYGKSDSNGLACGTYVEKALQSHNITTNAGCPFHIDMCVSDDSNLLIDTG